MNMMKYVKLLCAILLVGCGRVNQEKCDYACINLPLNREENILKLSEFVDSIQYVPLETQDECLIGSMDKLIPISNGCYLVVDKDVASTIYIFDQNGLFLRKIGNKGISKGEYVTISDVTCDNEHVYIWDSSSRKILKYSMEGEYISSLRFDYVAYSMSYVGEDKFAFCCDYVPNENLRTEDNKFPSLMILSENSGEVESDLFFESTISSFGYISTLNNLCNNDLYLPLNDTIYHVNNTGVERKYILKYDESYLENKNAYIERTKVKQISPTEASETIDDMYPHLITYFDCGGVDVFFMRMGDFLYYGFYYSDSGVYKEAAAEKKNPIVNDMDGVAIFSPRNSQNNMIFSIIEPIHFIEKQGLIQSLKDRNIILNEESNPVIVKMYMKKSI